MKQHMLQIFYTDDLLLSLKKSREQFEREARYLLAVKLYEMEKISSGKAAQLAGLDRVSFLLGLGQFNISPFQVTMEEILEEAKE